MTTQTQASAKNGKRVTVLGVLALLGGMTLLVVYAVPLYELFCRATGFGGYTQRADVAPVKVGTRTITVRFLSNTNPNLNWRFNPEVDSVKVKVGERNLIAYVAKNTGNRESTGVATFNVTPAKAGMYFTKIACFCFDLQTLKAGEQVTMPVSFFIDPDIAKDRNMRDVKTITLSYTFFPATKSAEKPKGKQAARAVGN